MRHTRSVRFVVILAACVAATAGASRSAGDGKPIALDFHAERTPWMAFSADGESVQYCTRLLGRGKIELKTGKVLAQTVLDGEYSTNALFAPAQKFWLTAVGSTATIRNPGNDKVIRTVQAKGEHITSVSVRNDGKQIVLVTEKSIEVCDTSDASLVAVLPSKDTCAVLSDDGRLVASGDRVGNVTVREVTGAETVRVKLPNRRPPGVAAVVLTPDDSRVVAGTQDGRVWLVHVPTGKVEELADVAASVTCLALNRQGTLAAVGTVEPSFHVVDVATKKQVMQIDSPPTEPGSIVFSPDSSHVVIGCWDGTCSAYRIRDGTRLWSVLTTPPARQKK